MDINELKTNDVYYMVLYPERTMSYPEIQTYVFAGKNIFGDEEEDIFYFQLSENYAKYGSVLTSQESNLAVFSFDVDKCDSLLDENSLQAHLLEAKKRRLKNSKK